MSKKTVKVMMKLFVYLATAVLGYLTGGCANNGTIVNHWSLFGSSNTNAVDAVEN